MKPLATGHIVCSSLGTELVLSRTFPAPIEDVWASLTEPERTAQWIGPWSGDAAPGATVMLTMSEEDGSDPQPVVIQECDPPNLLVLAMGGDVADVWVVRVHLAEANGATTLELRQLLSAATNAGDVGPGWEFYLDRLVASRSGVEMLSWDAYYPSQSAHFDLQVKAGRCNEIQSGTPTASPSLPWAPQH